MIDSPYLSLIKSSKTLYKSEDANREFLKIDTIFDVTYYFIQSHLMQAYLQYAEMDCRTDEDKHKPLEKHISL